jgi:hypothetical protein
MTATSTPTFDMLPNMREVAAVIAKDASENLAGVDVVSVGPLLGEQVSGGMRYSVYAVVPARGGKDYGSSQILLVIAQDPFMAAVYRTALIVAFEEFFGRVQIFGDALTLAKYCQKEWPSESIDQLVAEIVRGRGLNEKASFNKPKYVRKNDRNSK